MIYGSVCSGIEAASVAWDPLGWRAAFLSEIDPFPRAVLSHRFPGVPLHGDFTTIDAGQYEPIDLLVGGTPCQSFSVAGLRGGLGDDRGNLALEYLRLADRLRPRWLVWENVPGVLSSGGGRDFGAILGGMVELGYGFAYRVLDAQHVRVDGLERAVPQRRRRVFVVGYSGDWRRAAAVFFERESLCGYPAPRREAGQGASVATDGGVAGCLAANMGKGNQFAASGHFVGIASTGDISHCLNAGGMGRIDYETETMIAHSLRASGFDASEDGTGRGTPLAPTYTLAIRGRGDSHNLEYRTDGTANAILTPNGGRAGIGVGAIAFAQNQRDEVRLMDVSGALAAEPGMKQQTYVATGGPHGRMDDSALAGAEDLSAGALRDVRSREGRGSPQERGLAGQRAGELGAALSKLSHEGASPEEALRHLRSTPEGARLLQQASVAGEAVGRPLRGEGQSEHATWAVRRLTPTEAERLQGFPDGWTDVPYRGKPAADGPRYKALGNSMAVNVMRHIGRRIELVESIIAKVA